MQTSVGTRANISREHLDKRLTDKSRVHCRAACDYMDPLGDPVYYILEVGKGVDEPCPDRFAQSLGFFADLLEHKVRISRFLSLTYAPVYRFLGQR